MRMAVVRACVCETVSQNHRGAISYVYRRAVRPCNLTERRFTMPALLPLMIGHGVIVNPTFCLPYDAPAMSRIMRLR